MINTNLTPKVHIYRIKTLAKPVDVRFNIVSPDGELSDDVIIDVRRAQVMHDFAITTSYAVFLDQNLVFQPKVSFLPPVLLGLFCLDQVFAC
jgi:carotenoid cleavage dioxygenase-like enzyme